MTTQVLTLVDLQNLFFAITKQITGWDKSKVRQAFQQQGQPAQAITDNLVYIHVQPVDDQYDKQRNLQYSPNNTTSVIESTEYTRVIEVIWYIYGPLSFDTADLIRHAIQTEPSLGTLRASQVYPIPGISPAQRVPYSFAEQWWERNDLVARFNVDTVRDATVPFLAAVNVKLYEDNGIERDISINS